MEFKEPKVELIRVETNQVVFASGCDDSNSNCTDGAGSLVYCNNSPQEEECATGNFMFGE